MQRAMAIAMGIFVSCALVSGIGDAAPKKKKALSLSAAVDAPDFDKQAAISALTEVRLDKCKVATAPVGDGHVMITFAVNGSVKVAKVDKGPWVGTPVARCMAKAFRKAKVPAFRGEPITVGKTFHFE